MPDSITHDKLPRECPSCRAPIRAAGRRKGLGPAANLVVLLSLPFTGAWAFLVFKYSPIYVMGYGLGGILLCVIIYAWPLVLAFWIGGRLPMKMRIRCLDCAWSDTFVVKRRKKGRARTDKQQNQASSDEDRG